ncbi:hypothetical protein ACVWYH_001785 [Bradyrhizobium sp. GM24.11]
MSGLRTHLMEPELFKEFCEEFTREVNRLRIERRTDQDDWQSELGRVEKQIRGIITAIKDGMYQPSMKAEMDALEARKAELTHLLANAEDPPPLLHLSMAEIYRQRISALYESLQSEEERSEAAEVFRTLVDQVTLVPEAEQLAIVLRGDLAAILRFAAGKKNPDFLSEAGALDSLLSQASVVAGRRNTRSLRNGAQNANGAPSGAPSLVAQESMVVGARRTHFLRLIEHEIPKLVA